MNVSLLVLGLGIPGLILLLGCWLGYQLLRQNGRILLRLERLERQVDQLGPEAEPATGPPHGLPVGTVAPEFELSDLAGNGRGLSQFRGQRLLLIFFNPRCGFCTQMLPDLAALPVEGRDGLPLPLVVSTGDRAENRRLFEEHLVRCPVLLQKEMEVAAEYQCHGTPMGYLIDEQGKIASPMAVGAPALLALVNELSDGGNGPVAAAGNGAAALGGKRSLADSKIPRNGLAAGTPAPGFTLPRLDGGELSLEAYRGRPVLLVFSDPHCGPCDQLAPQLERQHRRGAAVPVLMVSRGEEAANRAKVAEHGLTFPVALQRQWEISRQYGMFATPIAYLIDAKGVIAAEAAVGVEPILALLSRAVASTNGKTKAPWPGRGVVPMR